jgi:hypothetical protein
MKVPARKTIISTQAAEPNIKLEEILKNSHAVFLFCYVMHTKKSEVMHPRREILVKFTHSAIPEINFPVSSHKIFA